MAPRQKLAMNTIVDAAIDLADAEGLAALSMRKLADRLGVGTMSLYRHVADKDHLVEKMADETGRRFPYPIDDPGPWPWRQRVQVAVNVDWDLYQHHPWMVLAYASPRSALSPTSIDCLRWLSDGFAELGVGDVAANNMALAVWDQINGVALAIVADDLIAAQDLTPSQRTPAELKARLDNGVQFLCRGFETTPRADGAARQ